MSRPSQGRRPPDARVAGAARPTSRAYARSRRRARGATSRNATGGGEQTARQLQSSGPATGERWAQTTGRARPTRRARAGQSTASSQPPATCQCRHNASSPQPEGHSALQMTCLPRTGPAPPTPADTSRCGPSHRLTRHRRAQPHRGPTTGQTTPPRRHPQPRCRSSQGGAQPLPVRPDTRPRSTTTRLARRRCRPFRRTRPLSPLTAPGRAPN